MVVSVVIPHAARMAQDICGRYGKRLRAMRVKHGWSQEELAHRAGTTAAYVSRVETSKREPCLKKMDELAQALGITLAQMMKGL